MVVGSVARGTERPDSDVDVYLVVDDASFDEAMAANRLAWVERRDADYAGGYLDIKLASPRYLAAAIERRRRPDARVVRGAPARCSIGSDSNASWPAVVALPEEAWAGRIRSHVSQARLHGGYFLRQAAERDERFLLHHAGVHLTFAAARAAFAANRVFLRGPKYVAATLAAVETPPGFLDAWWAVVDGPDARNGRGARRAPRRVARRRRRARRHALDVHPRQRARLVARHGAGRVLLIADAARARCARAAS